MRILFAIVLTFFLGFHLQAQTTLAEKQAINQFSQKANQIILHINTNISALKLYQNQLNAWYLDNKQNVSSAPIFTYKQVYLEKEVSDMVMNNKVPISNPVFNYKSTLTKLNQQVTLFNSFCKELQKLQRLGTKDEFYKKGMSLLYQIDNMAPEMVDYCYDFSLSCAVNFGKEVLPVELERLKTLVGQSKNVIMAIRQNSAIQVKSYLKQLDDAIGAAQNDTKLNDLRRVGKFSVDEASLITMHQKVVSAANLIAFWAEQYLQSNQTDEEVLPILESAILSFNALDGNLGCASAYNDMVSNATQSYLMFTEEPMFFEIDERERSLESIAQTPIKTQTVPANITEPTVSKVPAVVVPEKAFDKNDVNSLDGALPNNLIIMMDVSASMKSSGKLPLLKSSILHLVNIMRPEDKISLIAYSGKAELLISNAGIESKNEILQVLDTLHSSGGTDILNGMNLGFEIMQQHFMSKGNNRIIVATDGQFGVRPDLLGLVETEIKNGIVLSVFHFIETKNDAPNNAMSTLAKTGKGNYKMILNSKEALEKLIQEVKVE